MNRWKVTAIIAIVLLLLETGFIVWGVTLALNDEKQTNDCYYNFCSDYPEAQYIDGTCLCYDYDLLGELRIAKTKYK